MSHVRFPTTLDPGIRVGDVIACADSTGVRVSCSRKVETKIQFLLKPPTAHTKASLGVDAATVKPVREKEDYFFSFKSTDVTRSIVE